MENNAGIAGTLATKAEAHQNIYGNEGLFRIYVDIKRDSGTNDRIICIFKEEVIDLETYGLKKGETIQSAYGLTASELLYKDQEIMIMGKIQTYKDNKTGRIVVFVLADYIAKRRASQQNGIHLEGEIVKDTVYRKTPQGRYITDILLKVPSAFSKSYSCFIPVICWGKSAEVAAGYQKGDRLAVNGRLQSREYIKKHNLNSQATITTYEVSAGQIMQYEEWSGENGI